MAQDGPRWPQAGTKGSQENPKPQDEASWAKISQDCSKIAKPKIRPRWLQDIPRWSQDGPDMAQDGPRCLSRAVLGFHHGPSWALPGFAFALPSLCFALPLLCLCLASALPLLRLCLPNGRGSLPLYCYKWDPNLLLIASYCHEGDRPRSYL
jgi:hypothetical protein